MKNIFSNHKKIISGVLIFLIIFPMLSTPKAQGAAPVGVPVTDIPHTAVNTKSLGENIISAIQGTLTTINTNWPVLKTRILDPLAKLAMRILIKEMKRMALNYIINGNAGKPQFVTNFQLDAKQAAENAARSYLSQLTGVNFCNFFPSPQQSLYSLNFQFQLECSVTGNSNAFTKFLRDPVSVTEIERILALDPSTDFVQTIITAEQQKAQSVAQAGIARAAQVSSNFIGDTVKEVFKPSQEAIAADTAKRKEAARQAAIDRAEQGTLTKKDIEGGAANIENAVYNKMLQDCLRQARPDCNNKDTQDSMFKAAAKEANQLAITAKGGETDVEGRSVLTSDQLQAIGDEAAAAVTDRAPEPTFIDNIKTPGQAVAGLLNNATMNDFMGPTVAKEFDEAVIQIVDTAFQVMISKGLNNVFGH